MRKSPLAHSFLTLFIKYPKLLFVALLLGGLLYGYEVFIARDTMVFQGIPKATQTSMTTFTRIFRNQAYMVGYSDFKGNPLWVSYKLSPLRERASLKRPENFKEDWRNLGFIRSADYTHSGYDRGHMAPNQAIAQHYGKEAQEETFLMSNITPQKPSLNQKLWQRMESMELEVFASKFETLWVYTGPLFYGKTQRLKGSFFIEIPDAFYKIYVGIKPNEEICVLALIVPQNASANGRIENFVVSIDEVEKRSGFDFLHALEDTLEERLEKEIDLRAWF